MEWKTRKSASEGVQTSLIGLMDNLTKEQQIILAKLQEAEEGMHINLIVMETGLAYGEVASELTMLEIEGLVRALPGGVHIKI
jgi:predicted Rossmann fold nucleotide-binding protein DprA/Smf involved in DNA uptake